MSTRRWRHALPVIAGLAAVAVLTAVFSLGLFLIPAAFGFAMAAVFDLIAVRDVS